MLTEETLAYFAGKPGFSLGQMSWYQRAREQYGMFIKCDFPTLLEECFQTPIEGAIYSEVIDRLRANGAIRPAAVDTSALEQMPKFLSAFALTGNFVLIPRHLVRFSEKIRARGSRRGLCGSSFAGGLLGGSLSLFEFKADLGAFELEKG